MKAFWWFEHNTIAGMARPGFNCSCWFEFSFEEAVLVGWLGQFSSGSESLNDFRSHIQSYGPKILKFYPMDSVSGNQALQIFNNRAGVLEILKRVSDRSQFLEKYDVSDNHIHFEFSENRLNFEIEFLKSQGIRKVVSLTENHHSKETLQEHFDAYHFSINDLDAPTLEQVQGLAEIIQTAKKDQQKIAVHCLAGIGRTSTMLIGAHIVMGKKIRDLKALISRQNPAFHLSGKQAEFIHSI